MVGLTQHRLATLTGISYSKITKAETGHAEFTSSELRRIKQALAARANQVVETVAA